MKKKNNPANIFPSANREGGVYQYLFSSRGECRKEVCSALIVYSRLLPVAIFREHQTAADGGELIKEDETLAKERRGKELDTV